MDLGGWPRHVGLDQYEAGSCADPILPRLPADQKRKNGPRTEPSRERGRRVISLRRAKQLFPGGGRKSSKQCRLAGSRHPGTALKRVNGAPCGTMTPRGAQAGPGRISPKYTRATFPCIAPESTLPTLWYCGSDTQVLALPILRARLAGQRNVRSACFC